jgi:hypothetical protein
VQALPLSWIRCSAAIRLLFLFQLIKNLWLTLVPCESHVSLGVSRRGRFMYRNELPSKIIHPVATLF